MVCGRLVDDARGREASQPTIHLFLFMNLWRHILLIFSLASDPVGNSLFFIVYNLVNHPDQADLLYHELADIDISDNKGLSQLSHLNAIIAESSRLFPSIPTAGFRKTGSKGIVVGETYIPPETTIVAPRYSIFRSMNSYNFWYRLLRDMR